MASRFFFPNEPLGRPRGRFSATKAVLAGALIATFLTRVFLTGGAAVASGTLAEAGFAGFGFALAFEGRLYLAAFASTRTCKSMLFCCFSCVSAFSCVGRSGAGAAFALALGRPRGLLDAGSPVSGS